MRLTTIYLHRLWAILNHLYNLHIIVHTTYLVPTTYLPLQSSNIIYLYSYTDSLTNIMPYLSIYNLCILILDWPAFSLDCCSHWPAVSYIRLSTLDLKLERDLCNVFYWSLLILKKRSNHPPLSCYMITISRNIIKTKYNNGYNYYIEVISVLKQVISDRLNSSC